MTGMRFKVVLIKSDEGYAVGVPALPGCLSQGATEAEALENIADAIRGYIEVGSEGTMFDEGEFSRYVDVDVKR